MVHGRSEMSIKEQILNGMEDIGLHLPELEQRVIDGEFTTMDEFFTAWTEYNNAGA